MNNNNQSGLVKVLMPQLGETVNEGTVSSWHKQVGDAVKKNEILLDVETDKAAVEVPAPDSGVVSAIHVEEGETVDVGTVLAVIEAPHEGRREDDAVPADVPTASKSTSGDNSPQQPVAKTAPAKGGGRLSPAVRRLLAEYDIDAGSIIGTGPGGRITRQDVIKTAKKLSRDVSPGAAGAGDRRIPFDHIRKITAEHMVRSKATSPHVLQAVEVDFTAVESVRNDVGESWRSEKGYSLTYLPFVAGAVVKAIAAFPNVNASIDEDSLVVHNAINLSIAVNLNFAGLVAPVIRNCAGLTVGQIADRIRELSERARARQLNPDELRDGTYTLSNSGSFGTLITAPIINQPQVAILSVDGVSKKAVVIEGQDGDSVAIRPVGILAQSFDHRAFDGAYSGAFLNHLREILTEYDWASEF